MVHIGPIEDRPQMLEMVAVPRNPYNNLRNHCSSSRILGNTFDDIMIEGLYATTYYSTIVRIIDQWPSSEDMKRSLMGSSPYLQAPLARQYEYQYQEGYLKEDDRDGHLVYPLHLLSDHRRCCR